MFQLINIAIIIWELICIITMYHVYTCSFLCWSVVIASSSQILNMGQMRSWEVVLHRKLHSCSLSLYCHRLYPDEELGGSGRLSSYSEWKKPDLNLSLFWWETSSHHALLFGQGKNTFSQNDYFPVAFQIRWRAVREWHRVNHFL